MFFRNEYAFLSNMTKTPITFDYQGYRFIMPSSENAFQAMKVYVSDAPLDVKLTWLKQVEEAEPKDSKALGRKLPINLEAWGEMSGKAMRQVLLEKFARGSHFADLLLATGEVELVEDNNHGDTLWGAVNGVGENRLGKILMDVRDYLRRPF